MHILITGSQGLVGRALCRLLVEKGHTVVGYDLKQGNDVCDAHNLSLAIHGKDYPVDGIVHLAAVSRVVHAQQDPKSCLRVNVGGTINIIRAAFTAPHHPWVLFASSREVYGEAVSADKPVTEKAEPAPFNVYAESKMAGERLMEFGSKVGLRTAVVRLSNVYGDALDHHDRVAPAFARAAAEGGTLHVEDGTRIFDFVHIDDAARGIALMVSKFTDLPRAEMLPLVHFVTGRSVTLKQLAEMSVSLAPWAKPQTEEKPGRTYDVKGFVGDPSFAAEYLGWKAEVKLEDGLRKLIEEWRPA